MLKDKKLSIKKKNLDRNILKIRIVHSDPNWLKRLIEYLKRKITNQDSKLFRILIQNKINIWVLTMKELETLD